METGGRPKEEAVFTWQCDCSRRRVKALAVGRKMDACVLFIHNVYLHKTSKNVRQPSRIETVVVQLLK